MRYALVAAAAVVAAVVSYVGYVLFPPYTGPRDRSYRAYRSTVASVREWQSQPTEGATPEPQEHRRSRSQDEGVVICIFQADSIIAPRGPMGSEIEHRFLSVIAHPDGTVEPFRASPRPLTRHEQAPSDATASSSSP